MGLSRTVSLVAALTAAGLGLAWYTASTPFAARSSGSISAIDPTKNVTRIVAGSCANQRKPTPAWASLAKEKPDLVLLMGDNVYGSETRDDPDMKELAAAYDLLARDRGFQALRKSTPILAIWDDHDFGPNDAGGDFPYKARSKALFTKFWRIPADAPRARRDGIYDSVILGPAGQRVQIVLLDTRWFRDPLKVTSSPGAPGQERYVADLDPKHTLLGEAQWAWLERELKKPAEVRLIVSSIQVIAEGHGYEKWANFPNERRRLFDLIASTRAKGVIFLSGDRHVGAIYRRLDAVPYPLFELTASSLNSALTAVRQETDPDRLGPLLKAENYGVVSIDWARQAVTLELKKLDGRTVRLASVAIAVLYPPETGTQSVFWSGQPLPAEVPDLLPDIAGEPSPEAVVASDPPGAGGAVPVRPALSEAAAPPATAAPPLPPPETP